ncbi:MAG TPA: PKD domain-containing protein [Solirubrobacteraceae bacterium]|jgi:PKD repeat protein|nr:PKD domain-containing protein [Solirubrobacteraceae bacterium]
MTAPIRHGALGLLVGAAVLLAAGAPARAAGVADARISTTYVMHGRIVSAVRVRGEHRGQSVTRRWTFTGAGCSGSVCRRLSLRRQRSANHSDRLTLSRVGVGSYAGRGRFSSALECRGRRYRHGLVVPFTITVQVTQAIPIQGITFAGQVSAVYTNRRRIDRTRCPIGPSHDAAQYLGVAAPLPSPPAAGFLVAAHPADDSATFTDTSAPGAGGAPIASRVWQFGDPASGAANTTTANPAGHTFSAPGVYPVALTVTDANGLSATATRPVTAPGPPSAAFTDARVGTSRTFAFQDTSQPGIGGAAVTGWIWSFGDPRSPDNISGLQNPQHAFSAPGTYQVCLIVTDANRRKAGQCAPVVVPAGTQAAKRTVASTALSSPTS